jgi:hypothetical protein
LPPSTAICAKGGDFGWKIASKPVAGLQFGFIGLKLKEVLPAPVAAAHAACMFILSESDIAAIQAAFSASGELAAVTELRQRFPALTDIAQARDCVRTITTWRPSRAPPDRPARRRRDSS